MIGSTRHCAAGPTRPKTLGEKLVQRQRCTAPPAAVSCVSSTCESMRAGWTCVGTWMDERGRLHGPMGRGQIIILPTLSAYECTPPARKLARRRAPCGKHGRARRRSQHPLRDEAEQTLTLACLQHTLTTPRAVPAMAVACASACAQAEDSRQVDLADAMSSTVTSRRGAAKVQKPAGTARCSRWSGGGRGAARARERPEDPEDRRAPGGALVDTREGRCQGRDRQQVGAAEGARGRSRAAAASVLRPPTVAVLL